MTDSKTEGFIEKQIKELQAQISRVEQEKDGIAKQLSNKNGELNRLRTALLALEGKPVVQTRPYGSGKRQIGPAGERRIALGQKIKWAERSIKLNRVHGKERQEVEAQIKEW